MKKYKYFFNTDSVKNIDSLYRTMYRMCDGEDCHIEETGLKMSEIEQALRILDKIPHEFNIITDGVLVKKG